MAANFKEKGIGLSWYGDELLDKAVDLAQRLLKAFNTSSGLPYPRVYYQDGWWLSVDIEAHNNSVDFISIVHILPLPGKPTLWGFSAKVPYRT